MGKALIASCANGYRSIALDLLATGDIVNFRDTFHRGATPLIVAASNGHRDVISALLDHGAYLNIQVLYHVSLKSN